MEVIIKHKQFLIIKHKNYEMQNVDDYNYSKIIMDLMEVKSVVVKSVEVNLVVLIIKHKQFLIIKHKNYEMQNVDDYNYSKIIMDLMEVKSVVVKSVEVKSVVVNLVVLIIKHKQFLIFKMNLEDIK